MAGWFGRKFKEDDDRSYYREKNKLATDPEGVLAGMYRLRPQSDPAAPVPMDLLDEGSQIGRTALLSLATIGPGGVSFNPVTVLNLEADPKRAKAITIHCFLDADIETTTPPVYRQVRGIVEWGGGGGIARANFDWLRGTSFALVAAFVRVSAIYLAVAPDPPIKVGVFAGYEPVVPNQGRTPQLSAGPFAAAAGVTTAAQQVPQFGQNLVVHRAFNAGAGLLPGFRINYLDLAGAAVYSQIVPTGVQMEIPADLHNAIRSVSITNTEGVAGGDFSLIWGLAL